MARPTVPRNRDFEHLRQPHNGLCWWCGAIATTSEHKYKRSDLRLLGGSGQVHWGTDPSQPFLVRSTRKDPLVRFSKSLCANCNNARSQPFDRAYDIFRDYVWANLDLLWYQDGLDMRAIYGPKWLEQEFNLARYFVKHFGCRLVDEGVPPPHELAQFLDGAPSIPGVHLALAVQEDRFGPCQAMRADGLDGRDLALAGFYAWTPRDRSRLDRVITAMYVSYVAVRFEWVVDGTVAHSSFFPYPMPLLNHFESEGQLIFPPPKPD